MLLSIENSTCLPQGTCHWYSQQIKIIKNCLCKALGLYTPGKSLDWELMTQLWLCFLYYNLQTEKQSKASHRWLKGTFATGVSASCGIGLTQLSHPNDPLQSPEDCSSNEIANRLTLSRSQPQEDALQAIQPFIPSQKTQSVQSYWARCSSTELLSILCVVCGTFWTWQSITYALNSRLWSPEVLTRETRGVNRNADVMVDWGQSKSHVCPCKQN